MTAATWMGAILRPDAPGFWLVLDLLVAAAFWVVRDRLGSRGETLARPLRWVLVPGAALLAGAVSPQIMGLAGIDWQVGLTLGLGMVLGLLLLLGMVHLTLREATPTVSAPGGSLVLYAAIHGSARQFHWCFQRGAMLAVFTAFAVLPDSTLQAPEYWAMWAAVLIALPGILFDPPGAPRVYSGIALVSTAILFFYTRNFWLCWLLHEGIMAFAGLSWLRPELRTAL